MNVDMVFDSRFLCFITAANATRGKQKPVHKNLERKITLIII